MGRLRESDSSRSRSAHGCCRLCGSSIAGPAAELIDGGRCCESCYLDGCKGGANAFAHAYEGFAESLGAALDLREHETGLHSTRVACHTLVLARRFIPEPAPRRRVYWGALLHDVAKIGLHTGGRYLQGVALATGNNSLVAFLARSFSDPTSRVSKDNARGGTSDGRGVLNIGVCAQARRPAVQGQATAMDRAGWTLELNCRQVAVGSGISCREGPRSWLA